MECEICGAPSRVLETREGPAGSKQRTRVCPQGHRFTSYEIHSAPFRNTLGRIKQYAAARESRHKQWRRDEAILADTRKTSVVARANGVTPGRVRQIRRNHI